MITTGFPDPFRAARRRIASRRLVAAFPEVEGTAPGGESYLRRAAVAYGRGAISSGLRSAERAAVEFTAAGDVAGLIQARWMTGTLHLERGELRAARREFERAEHGAREQREPVLAASCALTLGVIAHYRGDNPSSLRSLTRAEVQFRQIGSPDLAETLQWAAAVQLELGRSEAARVTADRAIRAAERNRSREALGMSLCRSAAADLDLGDFRLARARAQMAADIAERYRQPHAEAEAFRLLSVVARRGGDRDLWHPLIRHALALAMSIDDPWLLGAAWLESSAGADTRDERIASLLEAEAAYRRLGAIQRARALAGLWFGDATPAAESETSGATS